MLTKAIEGSQIVSQILTSCFLGLAHLSPTVPLRAHSTGHGTTLNFPRFSRDPDESGSILIIYGSERMRRCVCVCRA